MVLRSSVDMLTHASHLTFACSALQLCRIGLPDDPAKHRDACLASENMRLAPLPACAEHGVDLEASRNI